MFCRKDGALRLLLSEPFGAVEDPVESITDNPKVSLFGTDIPTENISARVEQKYVKIEMKLPKSLDPESPNGWTPKELAKRVADADALVKVFHRPPHKWFKGMQALGSNGFWFQHALPDKAFKQISKLVGRNCI